MSAPVRMAYVPGSAKFTYRAAERRTAGYRTWRGRQDMGWCWECLLCGEWGSSSPSREHAIGQAGTRHRSWCHVATGCHCPQPHITAIQAARLGIRDQYPYHLGAVLLRMAGGSRRYLPPSLDRHGSPFGIPGQHYRQDDGGAWVPAERWDGSAWVNAGQSAGRTF